MSDTKTIAVIGATGAQGGGLVRAILADPTGGFAARARSLNPALQTFDAWLSANASRIPLG
jgi:uncharacterized protein YbjT (DUF2867 family)